MQAGCKKFLITLTRLTMSSSQRLNFIPHKRLATPASGPLAKSFQNNHLVNVMIVQVLKIRYV